MKKGFYCDKDGEILLITENESNNSGVKSNNSQCIDCIHSEICQFYKTLGANVICYPCGFYEAKSNEELFKQALVEGVNRHIDREIREQKQIEEMARDLCENYNDDGTCYCDDRPCDLKCEHFTDAKFLYNKGYRKQSEWISVEDRLPETKAKQITICDQDIQSGEVTTKVVVEAQVSNTVVVVCKRHLYGKFEQYLDLDNTVDGQWANNVCVTHWMPLPEAPKMKGGEE